MSADNAANKSSNDDLADPKRLAVVPKRGRRRSVVVGMQAATESIKERQVILLKC